MKYFILTGALLLVLLLFSCREDDEVINTPPSAVDSTLTVDISGYVQKGPFINGTAITVSELDKKLVATGKNFTTQISDNKGSFSFKDIPLASPYVQLQANGFYFDEVKGEKSAAQLTLFGLTKVTELNGVNVNLLSYLEYNRVIYLMQEKEAAFDEAKKQAQREILTVFGIESDSIAYAEQLDISLDGDDNAILLAISAVLQADNSVAELSELVANIITDLKEDGTLNSQTTKTKLKEQAESLNLQAIRVNLEKRYEDMGVKATIPNFEQYIDSDGDGILNKEEDDTPENFEFPTQKDVAINTKITSNAVKISGLKEGGVANASVSHGRIVINGRIVTDSVTQVKNGDQLQLQLTSSGNYIDTVQATVAIGTLVKSFQVVTDDYVADAFSFITQKEVAVDSVYTSNTITVSGIPYETPLKIEGGLIIKNGKEQETDTISVKDGDELSVKLRSSTEFETVTSALVDINGVSASFSITTDDYTPDPFSFKEITNAKRSGKYVSDTITITGLPHPTPSGIAWFSTDDHETGAIYVNGEKYTNNSFSLKEGDQVWIEVTAAEEFSTTLPSSLIINDQESFFEVTTEKNPWQLVSTYPGRSSYGQIAVSIIDKIYVGIGIYDDYSATPIGQHSNEFYEYNTLTKTWKKLADFPGLGRRGEFCFSVDNKIFVGSGNNGDTFYNDLWEYDPMSNAWVQKNDFPGIPIGNAIALTIGAKGYVGGGFNDSYPEPFLDNYPPLKKFWEYDATHDTWANKSDFPETGRSNPIGFVIEGKSYIGGGNSTENTNEFWQYEPIEDSWIQKENFPGYSNGFGIEFSINNKGYAGRAQTYLDPPGKDYLYKYSPKTNSWQPIEGLQIPLNSIGASTSHKGYLLICDSKKLWEFTPPQE